MSKKIDFNKFYGGQPIGTKPYPEITEFALKTGISLSKHYKTVISSDKLNQIINDLKESEDFEILLSIFKSTQNETIIPYILEKKGQDYIKEILIKDKDLEPFLKPFQKDE